MQVIIESIHSLTLDMRQRRRFALAYSGLADTYSLQDVGFHGLVRPKDALSKARAAAMKLWS